MTDQGGGPWGGGHNGGNGDDGDDKGAGPRNPWDMPPRRPRSGGGGKAKGSAALDQLLRRGREQFGGGFPGQQDNRIWLWLALGLVGLWVIFTSFHRVDPQERGVVMRLGRYTATLPSGMHMTFPSPIDRVVIVPVEDIRVLNIGAGENTENLVLTGDQNIIDLAYSVRWNIKDPQLYLYELAEPDATVRDIAESAMRAELSQVSLNDAIGARRGQIEDRVNERMQALLDSYHSGIAIQGVAINKADPPAAVNEAFKEVTAAQQTAQSDLNRARAYAEQMRALSQGEAESFIKVYDEYKLAPEVTRRRMYYETMEKVLANTDKVVLEAQGTNTYLPLQTPLPKQAPAKQGE